jgi:hypothetical protein
VYRLDSLVMWIIAGVFALFLFGGCGGGSGGGDGDGSAELRLIGAGPTRHWRGRDHEGDARAMAAHGAGLTVLEVNECARGEKRRCRRTPDEWCPDVADAGRRIRAMRAHGVTTLVSVINANGCLEQELSAEAFAELVDGLRREAGTERVILVGVSEPYGVRRLWERWRAFTSTARALWPGELAMPPFSGANRDLSPAFPEIAHERIDYHPPSDAIALEILSAAPARVIVNTDNSRIFDPGPIRARPLVRRALETGTPLVFYGGPGQLEIAPTLAVIGEEVEAR